MADVNKLNIEVRDKIATLTSQDFQLVGGNSDYEVVFDFDEAWVDHNVKTALFVFGDSSVAQVFEGNICKGVAIHNAITCYVGVFSGDIVTTTPATISDIKPSITDIGGKPQDPTQSVYDQIIQLLNKYIQQGGGGGGSGQSGFSPIVKITPITNGHRVTITDINGDHSFNVLNGAKGDKGDKGEQGERGLQGKQGEKGDKGDDYVLTETDKSDIANLVLANFVDVSEVGQ